MTTESTTTKSILRTVLTIIGLEVAVALLLWVGLLLTHQHPSDHIRWFAASFIPPIVFLRNKAKKMAPPAITKTIIITLFITFIAFIVTIQKFPSL